MTVLTKSSMFIIQYVAILLGWIMEGIFWVIDKIGIPNVGLAIILFTVVIYAFMTPLQVKQQKFSKLNSAMQPEIRKIQDKYRDKKDQNSQVRMNEEMQAVYAKYGVSPTGSCLQLVIQLPILFALYQVIYHIPGYITTIGDKIASVVSISGVKEFITNFVAGLDNAAVTKLLGDGNTENVVDVIYQTSTTNWNKLLESASSYDFSAQLNELHQYIQKVTSFCGLNISDSPSSVFIEAWKNKTYIFLLVALIVPVLAYATQVLNYKLMPQAAPSPNGEEDPTARTMKQMNMFMPIMSAVFCFTLPIGIGIYWIAGALVRSIQQVIINHHLNKKGLDDIIEESRKKAEKKREKKRGYSSAHIQENATQNTRNLGLDKKANSVKNLDNSSSSEPKTFAKGSIASKANMVQDYNNSHKKK